MVFEDFGSEACKEEGRAPLARSCGSAAGGKRLSGSAESTNSSPFSDPKLVGGKALECGSIHNHVGCDQSIMPPKSGFVTFLNRLLIKQVIAALR